MEQKPLINQLSDRLSVRAISEAIIASRNDHRPAIAADIVFAELHLLIDEIVAEQLPPLGDVQPTL